MKIEHLDCFKAKVNYKRTDNLKDGSVVNGSEILVQALWLSEDTENYPNQWAFMPANSIYWIAESELLIIDKIESKEYHEKRNQFIKQL